MAEPIDPKYRIDPRLINDEQKTGDPFEGESQKERHVGIHREVVCTIFKRRDETFFVRVSLRSRVRPRHVVRYEVNLDRYIGESDFLKTVATAGGALAEDLYEKYGDNYDPDHIAKQAMEATREMLHEVNTAG